MSLDAYLAQHTSEDNASFARLQAKTLALKRQKVAHHLEDKNKLLLEGPGSNPTEEYGTSGQQPYTLVMTKHNPTSSLYYSPQQRPLSATEAAEFARRPQKSINIKATRLKPAEADPSQQQAPPGTLPPALARAVGLAAPATAGTPRDFNARLPTPALTPSALGDASPFMTWGDIEGTPLRLEPEEGVAYDPKALDGPTFSVPSMPKKEQVGHELANAKSIKELRKRQKAAKLAALFGAPPAAQRLVHSIHSTPKTGGITKGGTTKKNPTRLCDLKFGLDKGAKSVDAALRASYSGVRPSPSPSPYLSQRSTPTPSLKHRQQPPTLSHAYQAGTAPKGHHSSDLPAAKPAAATPQAGSITDNLLNI
ncbi:nuclear protein Es2-domain-containing protein [Dunaliella salina]|uniref:Nuclear protein Es2-domain-containing protein n=1 Tax=Dunaliella salina TaxID=3046 RepID=A0ABQ7GVF5_DUNSA|nr:nuclear protein Es2-domain-containing protein [Dunaliella salina]|eukprot:KAF5838598.1 nuclear protein Es2-domain-containing protein [Dunaliella salina]